MSIDSEKMAELKANALAELEEKDDQADTVEETTAEIKPEMDEAPEVEEPEAETKEEEQKKPEKKEEQEEKPAEETKADTEEAPEEVEIDGDAEDYLPPADYKAPVEEEPAKAEPDPEIAAKLAELEQENEWIKAQAAKAGVNMDRPSLDLTEDQILELEDTSPAMADFARAAIEQIKALTAKLEKPEPAKDDPDAQRKEATERTRKAIAAIPEMDYWFNYTERTGKAVSPAIDKAQKIAIEEEGLLQKDPAFAHDQVKRFQEAARRAVERINKATTAKAKTRKTSSLAAAPGSAPEGGTVERLKSLPPTQMLAEINKLPENQQRDVKRAIFG